MIAGRCISIFSFIYNFPAGDHTTANLRNMGLQMCDRVELLNITMVAPVAHN
jgi:hypothetical protein